MKTFLDYRARDLRKRSELYESLSRIVTALNLTAISGATCDRAAWDKAAAEIPRTQSNYVPDEHNRAESIMLRTEQRVIAILFVHDEGYYGQTLVGGNHDMLPFELEGLLKEALLAPYLRNPYQPYAVCGT